jgi:hypothetical protein
MPGLSLSKHAHTATARALRWLWYRSERRRVRDHAEKLKITQGVWTTPTVAEEMDRRFGPTYPA